MLFYNDGREIKHINKKMGNEIIKKACRLAGISEIYTNHCFRHTFVHKKLYIENYDLDSVGVLLGHQCKESILIYSKLTNQEKLKIFNKALKRKKKALQLKEQVKTIKTPEKTYKTCLSNCHNRWCHNGWCNSTDSTKCVKRYVNHYTCPLFIPSKEKKMDMINDYYANLQLLEFELNKKFIIYKDVLLFCNIYNAILSHLVTIDSYTDKIKNDGAEVYSRAQKYMKGVTISERG